MWAFLVDHWGVMSGLGGIGAAFGFLPRLYRGVRSLLALEKRNAELEAENESLKRQLATWKVYQDDLVEAIEELTKRKDRAG